MIYSDIPDTIILNNRTLTPDLYNLQAQVTSLARIASDDRLQLALLPGMQAALTSLLTSRSGLRQTRALDTDFVISPTIDAFVFYTLELTTSLLIAGTDEITVDLVVDGQIISTVKSRLQMTLALGVTQTTVQQKILCGMVPKNATVRLTTTSNSGTATLITSFEALF